jgi:uncharacterized membrane protein
VYGDGCIRGDHLSEGTRVTSRLILAYILIFLLLGALAAIVAWRRYHSHDRSYQRRVRREEQSYHRSMGNKSRSAGEDETDGSHPK